jgi:hypothetical protein
MKPITRDYKVSDLYMQEFSATMLDHFIDEQAAFSAFDADFANPFEADWQALLDAALAFPTDETVVDQLQQLTADVEAAIEAGQVKFRSSRYFIEKAFPNNPGIRDEFGFDDFEKARRTQMGMVQFMQKFFDTATKYAAQLAAAGYDAAAVAEIETLANTLVVANRAQEKFKGTRSVTAQDRVNAMNAVWNITVRVSKAGKIIFMNDPAKYQLFLLPASSETGEDISISGTVSALGGGPLEGVAVSIASLSIDTETDSNGNYAFGNLPEGIYTLDFVLAGYAPHSLAGVDVVDGQTTDVDAELTPFGGGDITISGQVQDNLTLNPIAGATVRIVNPEGSLDASTDAGGNYLLTIPAPSGPVSGNLEAEAAGYTTSVRPVNLNPGDSVVENFLMNPS